jgi:hypothetical protein
MAVAALVLEAGGSAEMAVAALLHDAVEDAGGPTTLAAIRDEFGEHVASIVAACSDTDVEPKPPWRVRKAAYLHHLRHDELPDGALLVSLADKVHNGRAIVADLRVHKEKLWSRFNERDPDAQLWYYRWLADIFRERQPGALAHELGRTVDEMTRLVAMSDPVPRFEGRKEKVIATIGDWERYGSPASKRHWKSGRSAQCAAESWLSGTGARSLRSLLDRHPELARLEVERGVVEAQVPFDGLPGGRRNHDLLLFATAGGRWTAIGVEAKADESFGETLDEYRAAAQRRIDDERESNAPKRLELVTRAVAGRTPQDDHRLGELRCQLFSGVAGTVAAAAQNGCQQALFLVHEFRTAATADRRLDNNDNDLRQFLRLALDVDPTPDMTVPFGPITLPGNEWVPATIPVYIAKLRTET